MTEKYELFLVHSAPFFAPPRRLSLKWVMSRILGRLYPKIFGILSLIPLSLSLLFLSFLQILSFILPRPFPEYGGMNDKTSSSSLDLFPTPLDMRHIRTSVWPIVCKAYCPHPISVSENEDEGAFLRKMRARTARKDNLRLRKKFQGGKGLRMRGIY